MRRLAESTSVSGTDWALGVEARSQALLSEGEAAGRLYRESIERLGRTPMRTELARAHLLYGEWLRRENRRIDAREQLRAAYQMLTAIGMDGFAGRARCHPSHCRPARGRYGIRLTAVAAPAWPATV
jgi:hypothetical protein